MSAAKANGFTEEAVLISSSGEQTEISFTSALALTDQGQEIQVNDDTVYIGIGVPTHKRTEL